ncbi:alternative oxidase-domain-containing protein [Cokeromyces recurvatus]|uniref:alternative oxidase-domain-containing protein n=1 Tax=Cokeromyces recurvatus TaxID=90255 RepID=UPI00221E7663|nr:alternative oxidase-domain-containing protein [Cokeromyces recurvatus]KAI7897681.1 alternative oxidase-domain-containing protein [Cokeromyces recurvatus]
MIKTISSRQALKSVVSATLVPRILLPSVSMVARRTITTAPNKQQQESSYMKMTDAIGNMPRDLLHEMREVRPVPMCEEFIEGSKLTTKVLEEMDFGEGKHVVPRCFSDKAAYYTVKFLRTLPDTYFGRNHYMRAVMLETVAAVPGMVGAMWRHMKSLRTLTEDSGWISHLLHEAENERMHLMTWMKCLSPSLFDRLIVLGVQGVFFNAYFLLYILSPKTAHRFCGYLEEEAVISYTHFLNDIDKGLIRNAPAPQIAIDYYNLHPSASVRDVVLAVRADEAVHRDANHFLSDRIALHQEDILSEVKLENNLKNETHDKSTTTTTDAIHHGSSSFA